jgi:hypothetical protein
MSNVEGRSSRKSISLLLEDQVWPPQRVSGLEVKFWKKKSFDCIMPAILNLG